MKITKNDFALNHRFKAGYDSARFDAWVGQREDDGEWEWKGGTDWVVSICIGELRRGDLSPMATRKDNVKDAQAQAWWEAREIQKSIGAGPGRASGQSASKRKGHL